MRLLLDTNRYGDLIRRDQAVVDRFQQASEVWISLVSLGELRGGFLGGSRPHENEKQLADLIEVRGVGILEIDAETTHFYGRVYSDLRTNGALIPTNDVWIAAQALQHNLLLDTRDEHFQRISGLRLVEP